MKKTFKIYAPTKEGSDEMFSDYEKDMARDNMIDMEIDDAKEAKLAAKAKEDTLEKEYHCEIKDRSEQGNDFYATISANSTQEAVDKLANDTGFDRETILDNINEIK